MADVQFANLSVRFGEKELLDYGRLVAGAFLKDTYIRKYGRSIYHFVDTDIGLIDKNDPMSLAIWGRLVKETTLEREQHIVNGELVQDHQTMESAPTSFFVFFIADHRIAFVPETKFAPTLGNLETTIRRFIKNEYDNWAKIEYNRINEEGRMTWKEFYEIHPVPDTALVPLTAKESIEKFVNRFAKIETLTVYVIKRNQDLSGRDLFEALVKKSEELEASSARFVVNGPADEGLDIDATGDFVAETTEGGYERVALRGKDENGDILKGTNEDFKLTTSIDTEELSDTELAARAYTTYVSNKRSDVIRVSDRDASVVVPKLQAIMPNDDE